MGSRVVSPQHVVNLQQLDVNFWKINSKFLAFNKQTTYWNWFFDVWRLHLRNRILEVGWDKDIMIHYNNHNNAYCWAVNAQTFETIDQNTVYTSTLLCTRKPYTYSYFEIFICIYNVRGEIDQMLTNTSKYSICCAANVYIFVYIFIGTPIVPLIWIKVWMFLLVITTCLIHGHTL